MSVSIPIHCSCILDTFNELSGYVSSYIIHVVYPYNGGPGIAVTHILCVCQLDTICRPSLLPKARHGSHTAHYIKHCTCFV